MIPTGPARGGLVQRLRRLRYLTGVLVRWRQAPAGLQRDTLGLVLLESARDRLLPGYVLGDFGKAWQGDRDFLAAIRSFPRSSDRSAERKWMLCELAALTVEVPGDSAEAGVYAGASSWLICDALQGAGKRHHAFDSFAGLSTPVGADGDYWTPGDMSIDARYARERLSTFDAEVHEGWIPGVLGSADVDRLCFVHIDVDLYEPTLATLEWLYPRLSAGGLVVCDDSGFLTCPGARRAIDEFMSGRSDPVLEPPTGQTVILKR